MKDKIVFDIDKFLERIKKVKGKVREERFESYEVGFDRFLEEEKDYYLQVKICKLIYSDIKSRSIYLDKLEKYCKGIKNLKLEDVEKIRYSHDEESYIIYCDSKNYEIYEDDIKFVYPHILDVPDCEDFEIAYDENGIWVYHKHSELPPFKLPERAEV